MSEKRPHLSSILWAFAPVAVLAACSSRASMPFVAAPAGTANRISSTAAPDAGFSVPYIFKGLPDGAVPAAGLIAFNGTLYGTTQGGGAGGAGAIFTTTPGGTEHVIYSFGSQSPDGVFPAAELTVLSNTLYGTATSGGSHGFGAIFKTDKTGHERVVYSFNGGSDGAAPYARLAAHNGALYGTTYTGGGSKNCQQGCGTVFSVTPSGTERVLYAFKGGSADGIGPLAPIVFVGSEMYGTTGAGGKFGTGTIFKVSTAGKEQVLHHFGASLDGTEPEAGLVSLGGKLYGTTNTGGTHFNGTVFYTTTSGGEHVIYNFKGGSDGANPEAALSTYNGKLYGTTAGGGTSNLGTVFAVGTGGNESVLHSFKSADGSDPRARLLLFNGQFYGTASMSGKGFGTIFKASP